MPRIENLIHRAHYAIAATRRVAAGVAGGATIQGALRGEAHHFAQHLDASRRRDAASRMVEAASELHGPLLGWRHGDPAEPRPEHAAADGSNFVAGTVPLSTGALPGALPGCTCTVAAPMEGAPILS